MLINKINAFNNYGSYRYVSFKSHVIDDVPKNNVQVENKKHIDKKSLIFLAGLAFIGAAAITMRRNSDLISQIRKGMELEFNKKIDRKSLSCVVNKRQLTKMLSELSEENYVASPSNIEKGIFRADLHSHTWRSDGWGKVEDIMDEAAKYADELHAKTGKKFLFAITDHDGVDGVKEALKIISDNPDKFKNLAFVPGVELSFIQDVGKGRFEGAEILAHCVNPYSENLNNFLGNLHSSRGKMIQDLIDEANEKLGKGSFSRKEMDEFYLKKPNENFAYNLRYRVLNYLQVKNLINEIASKENLNSSDLYYKYMHEWKEAKNFKSVDNFIHFLNSAGVNAKKSKNNDLIYEMCQKSFPKIENGLVESQGENNFETLIELFKKDKNVILGFAHPTFTFKHFEDKEEAIEDLIKKSNKMIKTTEKYHQAYYYPIKNGAITQDDVDQVNKLLEKYNLKDLGGRDNHSAHLLDRFM